MTESFVVDMQYTNGRERTRAVHGRKRKRETMLRKLKEGLSICQIERVTGISRGVMVRKVDK